VRRVTVKAPAKLPYLAMAWKAPGCAMRENDRDPYALEVLAAVLDGHDASRFSRNLVRGSRIAQSAGAGYDGSLRGEATFTLDGQPAEGKTIAELEAALRAELKRIQDEGRLGRGTGAGQDAVDRRPDLQARFADGAGHGDRWPRSQRH
jgi:zinc protease